MDEVDAYTEEDEDDNDFWKQLSITFDKEAPRHRMVPGCRALLGYVLATVSCVLLNTMLFWGKAHRDGAVRLGIVLVSYIAVNYGAGLICYVH